MKRILLATTVAGSLAACSTIQGWIGTAGTDLASAINAACQDEPAAMALAKATNDPTIIANENYAAKLCNDPNAVALDPSTPAWVGQVIGTTKTAVALATAAQSVPAAPAAAPTAPAS